MSRAILFLLCLCWAAQLKAQEFGLEWIDFSRNYVRISVAQGEGIYRVSHAELVQAGLISGSVASAGFQMMHRGQEVAIEVADGGDGQFDPGDALRFFAPRNAGQMDASLFEQPEHNTNPYVNLYDDKTYFFLSHGGSDHKRLAERNIAPDGLPETRFHWAETLAPMASHFGSGAVFPTNTITYNYNAAKYSGFVEGKGWFGPEIHAGASRSVQLSVTDYQPQMGQPRLSYGLLGKSNSTDHQVSVLLDGQEINSVSLFRYQVKHLTQTLAQSQLPNPSGNLTLTFAYAGGSGSRTAAGYVRLVYPQSLNMANAGHKRFDLPAASQSQARLSLLNVPAGAEVFDVTSASNVRKLSGQLSGNNLAMGYDRANQECSLLVWAQPDWAVSEVVPAPMQPLQVAGVDYLLITHDSVRGAANGYADAVEAYADYRRSAEGGGYNVMVVEFETLRNLFTYGEYHPAAIRRFADYMLQKADPQFLFILGNGLELPYNYEKNRPASESWEYRGYIPCYGQPCSDNAFTDGLDGKPDFVPALATGRLPAMNAQDVANYLDKVKGHEAQPMNSLRRKHLLHLSGGKTADEVTKFRGFMSVFQSTAEGKHLGGKVSTIVKGSTDAVEDVNVVEEINQGISMISYFGHGSATVTDVNLGYPSDDSRGYRNKNKYPLMLLNGCDGGQLYENNLYPLVRDWILTPDRGAILYLAHGDLGYDNILYSYTNMLYRTVFGDDEWIHKPFGLALNETIRRFLAQSNSDIVKINVEQFILAGDPAVVMIPADKPDFSIKEQDLFVVESLENPITASAETVRVGFVPANYGIVTDDPLKIALKRTFGDGSEVIYPAMQIAQVKYQDTLYFEITQDEAAQEAAPGLNLFEITLDHDESIAELREDNNTATLPFLIPRGIVEIVYPHQYSIVDRAELRLSAFNSQRSVGVRTYRLEIDTTDQFASPLLFAEEIAAGAHINWDISLPQADLLDSTVYYWRVRYADLAAQDDSTWATSSFLYVDHGPSGWSQSHFPQLKEATYSNTIRRVDQARRWDFQSEIDLIELRSPGAASGDEEYYIKVNGETIMGQGLGGQTCDKDALAVAFVDHKTGEVYATQADFRLFWNYLYCGINQQSFILNNDALNHGGLGHIVIRETVRRYLRDDNDLIILVSVKNYQHKTVNTVGRDLGYHWFGNLDLDDYAAKMDQGYPFIAITRRNADPGTATVFYPDFDSDVPPEEQILEYRLEFVKPKTEGQITSTRLGPAKSWTQLHYVYDPSDAAEDSVRMELIGVRYDGAVETLNPNIRPGALLDTISAQMYPYLQLRAHLSDPGQATPLQLDRWQIFFEPLPEGMLDFDGQTTDTEVRTWQEGETPKAQFRFTNLSPTSFAQPVIMQMTIRNEQSGERMVQNLRTRPLASGESVDFELSLPTIGWVGTNRVTVFANPQIQRELNYQNNIRELAYHVVADRANPLLQVTFDGRSIANGDVVSAKPSIRMLLQDENLILQPTDTANWDIRLSHCPDCPAQPVHFDREDISYRALPKGQFEVVLQPGFLEDGLYSLAVQASDASGNASGKLPYQVQFRVIGQPGISQLVAFPNPFHEQVRFAFDLTGSQVPDQIQIDLYNLQGKRIAQLTKADLGDLYIGKNTTEFVWDGTDRNGNRLPAGMYLFRAAAFIDGQPIPINTSHSGSDSPVGYGRLILAH